MKPRLKGQLVEQLAVDYLRQNGLKIHTQNYRCRFGEIDIIAEHDTSLIFVEVRYRKDSQYGGALASVDYKKQQKILLTAQDFLNQASILQQKEMRFDVIAVQGKHFENIEWIQAAFTA